MGALFIQRNLTIWDESETVRNFRTLKEVENKEALMVKRYLIAANWNLDKLFKNF
jgi:hypothetical protein